MSGCSAFAHVEKGVRGKIDRTSQKRKILKSSVKSRTNRVDITKKQKGGPYVRKSRNVIFNEKEKYNEVNEIKKGR